MQVLRAEVWFGILGAVFVVAFLIWALDRFSPYSYYNNKQVFNYKSGIHVNHKTHTHTYI